MKNRKYLLFIFVSLLVAFSVVPLFAKYLQNDNNNLGIQTSDFYFKSDLLEEPQTNGVYPKYTLSKGVTQISFKLKNYLDEFRYSSENIEYSITLSGNINKSETGVITKGSCKTKDVVFNGLTTGTYTVVVTTTSPFKTTLKADFVITEEDASFSYVVNDALNSSIVQVIITTNAYSGTLKISWPSDLLPDNSNTLLQDAIGVTNININVSEHAEYTLIFFKQDITKVFTSGNIIVSKVV